MHRLRFGLLALFGAQFALLDAVFRGPRAWLERPFLLLVLAESALLWGVLAAFATTRRRRVVLALLAAVLFGVQTFLYRFLHVPLDVQIAEGALHSWRDVRGIVVRGLGGVGLVTLLAFAIELGLLSFTPRLTPRPVHLLFAVLALVGLFGDDPRHATPEVRGLHALTALRGEKPSPVVGAVALPPLHSDREAMPWVLFVLTESVRAEDYLPETTPFTSELVKSRVELREMRSVSSYTVVSLSAVITARSQEAARDDILRSATIFDFAHAAGAWVSYHSAHSRETFETKDVRAAVDRFVTLEDLAGREIEDDSDLVVLPLDRMIVDRFVADLPQAKAKTAVSVLHLAGTHAPYYFEDDHARFTPYDRVVAWSRMAKLRNAYKNAIVEQDKEVARAVRTFIDTAGARPWVVVFTSDHGEAFGEHGSIHHGQSLYDEQLHVPTWIASGNGGLDAKATRALEAHAPRFVTHLDLLPTVLDVLGLWDNFSIKAQRETMGGQSLLRPHAERGPIPVTNCTTMFKCPLNTWGLLLEDRKLVAQAWDYQWGCFELAGGERAAAPSDARCASLREASRRHFPLLPNGAPNR